VPDGLRPIDIYFESRLAFVDRPDVRLRTYREPARCEFVIEARRGLTVVSWSLHDRFMVNESLPALRRGARDFREAFDHWEQRAGTRALDRIRGGARVV
jgi:hypothetical protein